MSVDHTYSMTISSSDMQNCPRIDESHGFGALCWKARKNTPDWTYHPFNVSTSDVPSALVFLIDPTDPSSTGVPDHQRLNQLEDNQFGNLFYDTTTNQWADPGGSWTHPNNWALLQGRAGTGRGHLPHPLDLADLRQSASAHGHRPRRCACGHAARGDLLRRQHERAAPQHLRRGQRRQRHLRLRTNRLAHAFRAPSGRSLRSRPQLVVHPRVDQIRHLESGRRLHPPTKPSPARATPGGPGTRPTWATRRPSTTTNRACPTAICGK